MLESKIKEQVSTFKYSGYKIMYAFTQHMCEIGSNDNLSSNP